jgi:hypothetical protein
VADSDAAFMEQIFDVAKRQRKPEVHQARKLNDLGRCLEVAKGQSGYQPTVGYGISLLKLVPLTTPLRAIPVEN